MKAVGERILQEVLINRLYIETVVHFALKQHLDMSFMTYVTSKLVSYTVLMSILK